MKQTWHVAELAKAKDLLQRAVSVLFAVTGEVVRVESIEFDTEFKIGLVKFKVQPPPEPEPEYDDDNESGYDGW